jgi:hypothetical protein
MRPSRREERQNENREGENFLISGLWNIYKATLLAVAGKESVPQRLEKEIRGHGAKKEKRGARADRTGDADDAALQIRAGAIARNNGSIGSHHRPDGCQRQLLTRWWSRALARRTPNLRARQFSRGRFSLSLSLSLSLSCSHTRTERALEEGIFHFGCSAAAH